MPENNDQTVLSEDEKAELKRLHEENRKLRMEQFEPLCEGFAKESQ